MSQYNKILTRQINKLFGGDYEFPPEFQKLLLMVNDTYDHYEKDRKLLERSSELSSEELYQTNNKLREGNQRQKILLDKLKESIYELRLEEDASVDHNIEDDDLITIADLLREKVRQTKKFEEELRIIGVKFQAIVENTEDFIWSVDDKFRLSTFNSFFRKKIMSQYNVEPLLGDHIADIVSSKEYNRLQLLFDKAMEGKRFTTEDTIETDKQTLYYETSFNPIFTDDMVTGISVFSRDITSRKLEERKKTQLLHRVQSANKELEEIAYVTAHDLRTPLRSIGSIASWLSKDYGHLFDDEGQEQMDYLMRRVKRLYNLIDSVSLIISLKQNDGVTENVQIDQLINDILKDLNIPDNMCVEIMGNLPSIRGIKSHIDLVFRHLIQNAISFNDKPVGRIEISGHSKDQNNYFTISDNGPGIENIYFDKIFKVFQTLDPRDEHERNGIGLAIARKIIEMNEGQIEVASIPGNGCEFTFSLPKMKKIEYPVPSSYNHVNQAV